MLERVDRLYRTSKIPFSLINLVFLFNTEFKGVVLVYPEVFDQARPNFLECCSYETNIANKHKKSKVIQTVSVEMCLSRSRRCFTLVSVVPTISVTPVLEFTKGSDSSIFIFVTKTEKHLCSRSG